MKVTVNKPKQFNPIEITLKIETQRELEVLYSIANISPQLHKYINGFPTSFGDVSPMDVYGVLDPIYEQIKRLL